MYDADFAESTLNSEPLRIKALHEVDFILSKTHIHSGKILDVPCGTGRHSHLLAKRGFEVTGVDISEICLKIARDNWGHKNVDYQFGDMNDLKTHHRKYDLVLNLFSSFGYFATDAQNERVLRELKTCLKPDGTLVLNLINRTWLLSIYKENDWLETPDKYILNKRLYDPKTHYNEAWMKVIDKGSRAESTSYHRMRLYSKAEMVELLKRVGFKKIGVYGDASGARFKEKESSHPFYFARA